MKESKYKIKIVCGFRKDQEFTINANEAHKAYYLFSNPEKKAIFSNGLAIKGSDIQRIEPDYHATMDWNPTMQLTPDDWNEIHGSGVMQKLREIMASAKEISRICEPQELTVPLISLVKNKYQQLSTGSKYSQKVLQSKS